MDMERKIRYGLYALVVVLMLLPTIVGYASDKHFSGLLHTTDGNNFMSIMNQARDGHLLFTNMYTSEDVPYLNARPTYLLAGWASFILPNIIVYHLFRIAAAILLIYFLEKLLGLYFKKKELLPVLLIVLFASGFGWFWKLITLFGFKQYGSIDLWVTDANNFLQLMAHPHMIVSLVLMVSASYYFLQWHKSGRMKPLMLSAVLLFALGFEHLFDVITLGLAFCLVLVVDLYQIKLPFSRFKQLLVFAGIVIIPFIYTSLIFMQPQYSAWNEQNTLDTPKLIHVISGYGLMFFCFVGFLFYSKKWSPETRFIIFWIVSVLILIYSPFNIQRRFLEGAHIPFGIITGLFLFRSLKLRPVLVYMILLLMLPTNAYLYTLKFDADESRGSYPYGVMSYIENEEHEALLWLADNIEEGAVVYSTYGIGNYIPAYMNSRVYLGHWAQTINVEQKHDDIDEMYRTGAFPDGYIWYGVDEADYPVPQLQQVYKNDKVTIFRK